MIESYVRKPRWQEHELKYLEQHYSPDMALEEAASELGRTPTAVRLMLVRAHIKPPAGIKKFPWSEVETERLKALLPLMPVQDVCYFLNRSYNSVQAKLRHMGLSIVHKSKRHPPIEGVKQSMYNSLLKDGFSHEAIVNALQLV